MSWGKLPKDEPKEAEREITVTIVSRTEITTYPKINTPLKQTLVTYVGAGLAPRMIKIPTADYSLQLEKATIKADIQRRLKEPPQTYQI